MIIKHMVILVDSTSHALKIEQILIKNNLSCKLIPVPRHLSSDCGVCVRINADQVDLVKELAQKNRATYREIQSLE